MLAESRRDHGETSKAEPHAGLQGESGVGGGEGREDAGVGAAVRCASNQIKQWKDQLLEGAAGVFGDETKAEAAPTVDVKTLHAKIGELTLEKDFLEGALAKTGLSPSARR